MPSLNILEIEIKTWKKTYHLSIFQRFAKKNTITI